jgi:hypothetical protein
MDAILFGPSDGITNRYLLCFDFHNTKSAFEIVNIFVTAGDGGKCPICLSV